MSTARGGRSVSAAAASPASVVGAGALGGYLATDGASDPDSTVDSGAAVIPFRGPRHAGIITPAQDRLHLSLDVTT